MRSLHSSMISFVESAMSSSLDSFSEAQRIARRVAPVVVVEVHVDVRALAQPAGGLVGPFIELGVGIAAAVELLGAVKPHVGEVGGAVEGERKLAGGLGGDERDPVLLHEPERLITQPTLVSH